jgi:hypothetical protein
MVMWQEVKPATHHSIHQPDTDISCHVITTAFGRNIITVTQKVMKTTSGPKKEVSYNTMKENFAYV